MTGCTSAAPWPCMPSGVACGDLAFFALLQDWTTAHRHGSVATADFILAVDRATGLDSEALLHPWLYEEALPPLPGS